MKKQGQVQGKKEGVGKVLGGKEGIGEVGDRG